MASALTDATECQQAWEQQLLMSLLVVLPCVLRSSAFRRAFRMMSRPPPPPPPPRGNCRVSLSSLDGTRVTGPVGHVFPLGVGGVQDRWQCTGVMLAGKGVDHKLLPGRVRMRICALGRG